MNPFKSRACLLIILSLPLSSWAANPCMSIAMECMKVGYYKGGEKLGKGLIKDCVLPVTEKTTTLPNTSFNDEELNACHADIMKKMKEQQAS